MQIFKGTDALAHMYEKPERHTWKCLGQQLGRHGWRGSFHPLCAAHFKCCRVMAQCDTTSGITITPILASNLTDIVSFIRKRCSLIPHHICSLLGDASIQLVHASASVHVCLYVLNIGDRKEHRLQDSRPAAHHRAIQSEESIPPGLLWTISVDPLLK